jgi:uncharacterized repeat protein (TIGR03843 family)
MDDQLNEEATPQPERTAVSVERVLTLLAQGRMEVEGLMPDSSNYTFLARIEDDDLSGLAIYKPRRGERPLWDFPRGTLCQREAAAYLLSAALGWEIVPPTVLRDGTEYGEGSVQLFINADPEAHYFTMRGTDDEAFKRIAAFDVIANNADRKGGHILRDGEGRIWGIDHGITFHVESKLRTVIWEYAGDPIPDDLINDIRRVGAQLDDQNDALTVALNGLLSSAELDALRRRIERVLRRPRYPSPTGGRSMPWPPI